MEIGEIPTRNIKATIYARNNQRYTPIIQFIKLHHFKQ